MIAERQMEDSSIEWIGEVPENWILQKFKYIFCEKQKTFNADLNCGSISFGKVIKKKNESITESTKESYQELLSGEFLINPLNLNYDFRSLRIGLSEINVVVSSGYIVIQKSSEDLSSYLKHLLYVFDIKHLKSLGNGVRQTISFKHLANEKICLPPLEEQKRISDYLDQKTQQIDELIEKTEKKIELLKEQRIALINHCVTKGLNPDAEMKDSGIEWIGEIPEGWDVKKITHITSSVGSGTTPKSDFMDYYENGTTNWLVTGDLNDGIVTKTSKKISEKALAKYSSLKIYPKDSLIVAMYGATIGKLGILNVKTTVNQAACVLTFASGQSQKFWFYSFFGFRKLIISLSYGGGQPNISQDLIKNLRFPAPSTFSEQKKIADYLDEKTQQIDTVVEKEVRRISLLKEYRQSLISSAVTGKINITEAMV